MTKRKEIVSLKRRIKIMEAQLLALNAPYVNYDLEGNYVFYPCKQPKKKEVHNVLFGIGYQLVEEKAQGEQ